MRALHACIGFAALSSGCGHYADFSLPVLSGASSSPTFEWQALSSPVLSRGAPGDWDSADALNPSVLMRDALYYNFYSGFDGKTWRTGLATSADGLHWHKKGDFLSPRQNTWEGDYIAANGAALCVSDEFYYWYQAGPKGAPRIGLARANAAKLSWRKQARPVLETGPRGSWDEHGVADPYVLPAGDWFYMYYLGQDRARRQRLGLARSHDGIRWEKLRSNPILELGEHDAFDENGLGEPAVWASRGFYWMLYTGRNRAESRRLGLARSTDGVSWRKLPSVIDAVESWNRKVICDPSVIVRNDAVLVWFGGGDVASPDENLHGQIGFAKLVPKP